LKRAEVVGEQVRGHRQLLLEQAGRGVAEGERVDDAQPARGGQRRVQPDPAFDAPVLKGRVHLRFTHPSLTQ
jgi:hypothetical protein